MQKLKTGIYKLRLTDEGLLPEICLYIRQILTKKYFMYPPIKKHKGEVKNFKQCISRISGNDLSELDGLINRIKNTLHVYCHVSDFLPDSFNKELLKLETAINTEYEKREAEHEKMYEKYQKNRL